MYQLILGSLKSSNERLWFATSLRLGKIYLDEKNFEPLNELLFELKHACRTPEAQASGITDFTDFNQYDVSKGNLLLEAFALEIQMCIETREQRRMKEIFQTTKRFSVVIEDPRVVGIIKECGGKIYMTEKRWGMAEQEFVESFKSLLDVGSSKAQTLLKYVVLASLLSGSGVDYLITREAKIFAQDSEIIAMVTLKQAFENNDIKSIQEVLSDKNVNLLADPFINNYLNDLLRSVHLKALEAMCKPYKSVKLSFLAANLNVSADEIRSLLSELILEEKLEGQIDQVKGYLELRASEQLGAQKYRAMQTWGQTLMEINKQLTKQIQVRSDYEELSFPSMF
jgi:COP9 signalosome complex subunit 2